MADCECITGCPFFNDKMESKPALAEIFKRDYCRGDFAACARHMVFKALGKAKVPVNLFPNQQEKVQDIIKAG